MALKIQNRRILMTRALASAGTAWNPADTTAGITLSGANLIATHTAANSGEGSRANNSASAGKKYATFVWGALTSGLVSVGVNLSTSVMTSGIPGTASNTGISWGSDGSVFHDSGTPITTIQTYAAGDALGVAVDIDNQLIWFRTNSGNWNNNASANPATGTLGIDMIGSTHNLQGVALFPTCWIFVLNDNVAANFLPASPPAGFGNW